MELNGIKHTSMWVTEEEKVVIDAMRAGGDAQVHMHNSTIEKAEEHLNSIPEKILPYRRKEKISWDTKVFSMGDSFVGRIEICHYVDIKKPLTAGKHSQ